MMRYEFHDMGPANIVLFYKRAYKLSYKFWLDKLDCSVSCARCKVEGATFEDAMAHFHEHRSMNTICRRNPLRGFDDPPHFEVGFRTLDGDVDWFLYLLVDIEKNGAELLKQFVLLGGRVKE